jgi:hypothetical protein
MNRMIIMKNLIADDRLDNRSKNWCRFIKRICCNQFANDLLSEQKKYLELSPILLFSVIFHLIIFLPLPQIMLSVNYAVTFGVGLHFYSSETVNFKYFKTKHENNDRPSFPYALHSK